MIENKTNINWLVSIYPTLSKKIYKTRICEVYDLAFFNLQIKKQDKNDGKTSKTLYQIGVGIYGQHFYIFIII